MDLWIRSQDKSVLEKIEGLRVDGFRGEYYIATYTHSLGEYKTKERASEVLDEIQKFIEEFETVTAELDEYGEVTNVEHHKKVYEMPEE